MPLISERISLGRLFELPRDKLVWERRLAIFYVSCLPGIYSDLILMPMSTYGLSHCACGRGNLLDG